MMDDATLGPVTMGMDMGTGGGSSSGGGSNNAPELNKRYSELIAAWRSEEACPEVLEWRGSLFDDLIKLLESQDKQVAATTASEQSTTDDHLFLAPCYQKDMARIRYVLGAYARCRIAKLQRAAGHIVTDPVAMARLSERERRYCKHYLAICAKHHRASLLRDLPYLFADAPADDDDTTCPPTLGAALTKAPDMDAFVFARVKGEIGNVVIDGETDNTLFLGDGDVHVFRYGPVRQLVESGQLELF